MSFGMVMILVLTALIYISISVIEYETLNIFGYIIHIVFRFIVFTIVFICYLLCLCQQVLSLMNSMLNWIY